MSNKTDKTDKIDLYRRGLLKAAAAGLLTGTAGLVFPFRPSIDAAETEARKPENTDRLLFPHRQYARNGPSDSRQGGRRYDRTSGCGDVP